MIPSYTPLKKGKRTLANEDARRRLWPRILGRSRGMCEGCGRRDRRIEWAHIFGRPGSGLCLGSWANTLELTMALCVVRGAATGCHTQLDRNLNPDLKDRLGWRAATWFARAYAFDAARIAADIVSDDAGDVVRAMIRRLEAEGRTPDGLKEDLPMPR